MMKTNKSREYLMRALNEMPESVALQEAKVYIRRAISAVDNAEKSKRLKEQDKHVHASQWQFDLQSGLANPLTHKLTVQSIDTMINVEKQKLENIKKQNISATNTETLLG